MCLDGETLYVADTENHAIRAVDLKERQRRHGRRHRQPDSRHSRIPALGPARDDRALQPLGRRSRFPATRRSTSPWPGRTRSGSSTSTSETVGVFAGSGYENIIDGTADTARFAQPSGLATDGENLFVADSEVSGVRVITGIADTRAGRADDRRPGPVRIRRQRRPGAAVRLQHCLGLAYGDGHLYIADTYNNKIKVCDPRTHARSRPWSARTRRATAMTRPTSTSPAA